MLSVGVSDVGGNWCLQDTQERITGDFTLLTLVGG
jgi:hypothetical protein